MMRTCTLLLALASARAQTDNMQDPRITTSGGSIVISADDIQFTTPNQSTSINGLVRDVAQTFSSIRADLALATREIARVNVSLTSRIDAALGPILTRLEDAETAAANPRLPVVTTFADLPACNDAGLGVMTYLSEADGCKSVYVCLPGGLRQRTSYAGPVAGAARCNPAADCPAAIASAQGRPRQIYQGGAFSITGAEWDSTSSVAGTFFLGVVGGAVRQTRCEDSGLEAGDGSASTPGLSCESIYTHHPTQKARGPQVYKMFSPEGHGQFTGFPRTISRSTGTREGQTITCSGTRNATHTIGIMYGNPTGSVRRYNYYMLPASTNRVACTNSRFGDPQSGAAKYCYCGWYVRGTVDVKCNPRFDERVSLTGLVGWWRAENYQLALTSAEWPSLNPAVMFGTGPAITNRVAQIENPQGWSREARYETADNRPVNNAHARYNGLVGRSRYNQPLERNPGFFPNPAGTPGTGVNFGPLTRNYAICTTSRYMNSASSRARIFVGSTGNWLHGHWGQRTNVVHYGRWASSTSRGGRYDWIVTCTSYGGGNGRNFFYRYGGVSTLSSYRGIQSGAGKQFGIGIGDWRTRETSVYAFGEVLIYNVAKSAADLRNLALYLTDRLNGRR